jgi:hypothetical protein
MPGVIILCHSKDELDLYIYIYIYDIFDSLLVSISWSAKKVNRSDTFDRSQIIF